MTAWQAQPLSGSLGLAVDGAVLQALDELSLRALRKMLEVHAIVVFRGQTLSRAQHLRLALQLGEVQRHRYHADEQDPEFLTMKSDRALADFWHADETYETAPPDLCVLRVVQAPNVGGDTVWTDARAALESLSPPIRQLVDGLRAEHATPDSDHSAVHAVVRTHPTSTRSSLYVNRQFTTRIVGLSQAESDHLLELLFEVNEHPDVQCRHRWTVGDVAIWDNRCTLHRVLADYRTIRWTERVAVRVPPPGVLD